VSGVAERDLLEPASVFATRLQAQRFELIGDIGGRGGMAGRARISPFQRIAGEECDIVMDSLR
jgi:hypothetical protein